MKTVLLAAFFVGLAVLARGELESHPSVAFMCNLPAMYSAQHGQAWVKDDSTSCLKDPSDILNYCRKVFPTLDIRNVVESTKKVTITNWCDFGVTMCDKELTVTPYRCLVGPFQSDALLVPEHCVFDHIHDSKLCTSFSEWNKTSLQSCKDRSMVQQSFAMLQPCGIDKFNGVEFVCCPPKDGDVVVSKPVEASEEIKPAQRDVAGPRKIKPADSYSRYLRQSDQRSGDKHKWNEHEYYMKAKSDMQKHHHDKIAQMMKEWASARQRVQEMRDKDPKGSEKLNREITSRFQKMYEAEELEGRNEKKQLATLHHQRVQAEVNEKKEEALVNYLDILDDEDSDTSEIMHALKRYLKALHKDRLRAVNRYKHLELSDPEELDSERPQMAEHLRGVNKQFEDALKRLDRVPRIKNKIIKALDDYLQTYHSLDRNVEIILTRDADLNKSGAKSPSSDDYDDDDWEEGDDDEDVDDDWEDEEDEDDVEDDDDWEDEDSDEWDEDSDEWDDEDSDEWDDDDKDDDEDSEDWEDEELDEDKVGRTDRTTVPPREPTTKSAMPTEVKHSEVDEKKEDPMVAVDYFHSKDTHHAASNMGKNEFGVHEPLVQKGYSHSSSISGGFSAAVPLGIAVGGLTVFIVIVVGVVLMKRRHRQHLPLRTQEMDLPQSPEEKHVASMQMNGYENPTYKYFENNCSA